MKYDVYAIYSVFKPQFEESISSWRTFRTHSNRFSPEFGLGEELNIGQVLGSHDVPIQGGRRRRKERCVYDVDGNGWVVTRWSRKWFDQKDGCCEGWSAWHFSCSSPSSVHQKLQPTQIESPLHLNNFQLSAEAAYDNQARNRVKVEPEQSILRCYAFASATREMREAEGSLNEGMAHKTWGNHGICLWEP